MNFSKEMDRILVDQNKIKYLSHKKESMSTPFPSQIAPITAMDIGLSSRENETMK